MPRHRSRTIQSRNRTMLTVAGSLLLLFGLIVAGLYYYEDRYGADSSSAAYDRAVSDCVHDRTRVSSDVQDQATSDCVRDTTPDGDNK